MYFNLNLSDDEDLFDRAERRDLPERFQLMQYEEKCLQQQQQQQQQREQLQLQIQQRELREDHHRHRRTSLLSDSTHSAEEGSSYSSSAGGTGSEDSGLSTSSGEFFSPPLPITSSHGQQHDFESRKTTCYYNNNNYDYEPYFYTSYYGDDEIYRHQHPGRLHLQQQQEQQRQQQQQQPLQEQHHLQHHQSSEPNQLEQVYPHRHQHPPPPTPHSSPAFMGSNGDISSTYSYLSTTSTPSRRTPSLRRSAIPDVIYDDYAYRKLSHNQRQLNQRTTSLESVFSTSYMLYSPLYTPSLEVRSATKEMYEEPGEPDVEKDDLCYRKLVQADAANVLSPPPPFGIPNFAKFGYTSNATPSHYLYTNIDRADLRRVYYRVKPRTPNLVRVIIPYSLMII